MTPRPPTSTLFPYTTLFRSAREDAAKALRVFTQRRAHPVVAGGGGIAFVEDQVDDFEHRRDRKSTRLNSSHSQISYAVFCLKKKIKSHNPTTCITSLVYTPH